MIVTDIKPDNILISYTTGPDGNRSISAVCLADTEDARKLEKGHEVFGKVGNVYWRSPEGQMGIRIHKASDLWSFAAMVSSQLLKYTHCCPSIITVLTWPFEATANIGLLLPIGHLRLYQAGNICILRTRRRCLARGSGTLPYAQILWTSTARTGRPRQTQSLERGFGNA